MRRFVIGDIHGAHKALVQCLHQSGFNYDRDLLISLGDVCDGWPETKQCIDELLQIKNLIVTLGNHDQWALDWMHFGLKPSSWLSQGGRQTVESYSDGKVPKEHIHFLENAKPYYLSEQNELFVHAGIDTRKSLEEQDLQTLLFDRSFYYSVMEDHMEDGNTPFTKYKKVFLGHSPIHREGYLRPLKIAEVILMDTGAAWNGTLSMMDIDSGEVFVSEKPVNMYPKGSGRF